MSNKNKRLYNSIRFNSVLGNIIISFLFVIFIIVVFVEVGDAGFEVDETTKFLTLVLEEDDFFG